MGPLKFDNYLYILLFINFLYYSISQTLFSGLSTVLKCIEEPKELWPMWILSINIFCIEKENREKFYT